MSRIDAKALLYGHPALEVRAVLRELPGEGAWRAWEQATRKLTDRKSGRKLIEDLLAAKLIEESSTRRGSYFRTTEGNRLAMASARPLRRTTADAMIPKLIARAEAINLDDRYCYRVAALVLFGSYMDSTRDVLGDLDVGYELDARYSREGLPEGKGPFHAAMLQAEERARLAGRQFRNFTDQLFWPSTEVVIALKSRTPGLSLHRVVNEPHIVLGGPHKVVFGSLPVALPGAPEMVL